jgi:hypothetical protein
MPEKSLLIQGIQNRRAEHPRHPTPLDRHAWQPEQYRRRRDLLASVSVDGQGKDLAPEQRPVDYGEAVRTGLTPPSDRQEVRQAPARNLDKRGA